MAIGRTFEEVLQKALRMLEIGVDGLVGQQKGTDKATLESELRDPTPERIFAIAGALQQGFSIDQIHELTHVEKWFLYKIQHIVELAARLKDHPNPMESDGLLLKAKQGGFSDRQIGFICGVEEFQVCQARDRYGIRPFVKQIDTLAAEYPAQSNYLYLTYSANEDDLQVEKRNSVMVLGSGSYRIGSSVEFDWCCVNTVHTLRDLNYRTIMINFNPETVSTDYNECDALYFEEISLETVQEIYKKEAPMGVIVSMGGQTPNNLVMALDKAGVRVLGTSSLSIDKAENRHKFSQMLDQLKINQPEWGELVGVQEAKDFASKVGYPVLIRPSYVLSGATMGVASNHEELEKFVQRAATVSKDFPIVMSKFIENAKELEMDGVACQGQLVLSAISEHVENAGVHSGDATLVFPAQRTYLETVRRIKKVSAKIVETLKINGPVNIQFMARDNDVMVIECNLRASRSFPFVSKISKINFIDQATRVIMGKSIPLRMDVASDLEFVGVKAPQFSFTRLDGADPALGVEMASTGEVGCLGDDFEEAFLKALLSVGFRLPVRNVLLSTGPVESKASFLKWARLLADMGMTLFATTGTGEFLSKHHVKVQTVYWPSENRDPNVMDCMNQGILDLVINIRKIFRRRN